MPVPLSHTDRNAGDALAVEEGDGCTEIAVAVVGFDTDARIYAGH